MKSTTAVLFCLNIIFAIQAMDSCDNKQSSNTSMEQVIACSTQVNDADSPTFVQSVAQGALAGVMKYSCGINDDPESVKKAALKGAVQGAAQGFRRAYMILKHLQS